MKQISFFGAAGTVTGSDYLLKDTTSGEKGIVIDMGLFQGSHALEKANWDAVPFHPQEIEAVFVTHAHLDHSGRLPLLRKLGYSGPVYMTPATKSLLELTLLDAVKVSEEHNHGVGLYSEEDVQWLLNQSKNVEYGQPVTAGLFTITFRDAGHILGSAFLDVLCKNREDGVERILFSGDIGNFPEDIVRPTEMPKNADVVVMESTYGDHAHTGESSKDFLATEIGDVEKTGGTLLIPAFSIERSQEILHMIDHLKKEKRVKEDTLVFFDSPLGIKVTQIYEQYRNLYNTELSQHAKTDDPFTFPGLSMTHSIEESRAIHDIPGTKVIIAGSGMMTGGRIRTHAKHYLPMDSTRLLFVGFQASGSLGRELLNGTKMITLDGVTVPVRASVHKSSSLSSHADQPRLLQWVSGISGLSDVVLTHGENMQRTVLKEKLHEILPHVRVSTPERFTTLSFGRETKKVVLVGSSGK